MVHFYIAVIKYICVSIITRKCTDGVWIISLFLFIFILNLRFFCEFHDRESKFSKQSFLLYCSMDNTHFTIYMTRFSENFSRADNALRLKSAFKTRRMRRIFWRHQSYRIDIGFACTTRYTNHDVNRKRPAKWMFNEIYEISITPC